jgi:hypothetical protein
MFNGLAALSKEKWVLAHSEQLVDFFNFCTELDAFFLTYFEFVNYLWLCSRREVYLPALKMDYVSFEKISHTYYQMENYNYEQCYPFLTSKNSKNIYLELCSQFKLEEEFYQPTIIGQISDTYESDFSINDEYEEKEY